MQTKLRCSEGYGCYMHVRISVSSLQWVIRTLHTISEGASTQKSEEVTHSSELCALCNSFINRVLKGCYDLCAYNKFLTSRSIIAVNRQPMGISWHSLPERSKSKIILKLCNDFFELPTLFSELPSREHGGCCDNSGQWLCELLQAADRNLEGG